MMGNNDQRQLNESIKGWKGCSELWRNNAHDESANILRNLILNMGALGKNIKQLRGYSLNVLWTIFHQLFCNV